jgi:hypothetical protein
VSAPGHWDEEWRALGKSQNWTLPPSAPWPLRQWGIRYVRAAILSARVIQRHQLWKGETEASSHDDWVVYAIARGRC